MRALRKFWKFCSYFVSAEKYWRWPRQSRVLIFDACAHEQLLEYLEPWTPEVLHIRGERLNLRVLVVSLFRKGKRSDAYIDCYIERVRPTLVVTFIDNNVMFFSIRQRHSTIRTMFIQNGWRYYPADVFEALDNIDGKDRRGFKVDTMLSFGPVVGAEYAKYVSGTVIPMGSLKNNRVPRTQLEQRGTIAFVSQWRRNGLRIAGVFRSHEEFFGQTDRLILRCLKHYATQRGKRLIIIAANPKDGSWRSDEEVYFRDVLGQTPEFCDCHGPYPSYQAVDAAEVVVTVDTTMGYESIARGRRTAIFSVRGSVLGVSGFTYGWPGTFPVTGPFWTSDPDADTFIRILDHLHEIDETQWRKEVESAGVESLMMYDPGNSILKSVLARELGTQNVLTN